jgi:hypothetical protein
MKKTILAIVLSMTVLFILSTVSYAQESNHSIWYHGMAYYAEKEIRAKEQNATAKKNEKNADNIRVANAENDSLNISEETDLVEKTDEVEN